MFFPRHKFNSVPGTAADGRTTETAATIRWLQQAGVGVVVLVVTYLAAAGQVKRSPQTPAKVRPPALHAASAGLPVGRRGGPAAEPSDRVSPRR